MTLLYRFLYSVARLLLAIFHRYDPKLKKGVELRRAVNGVNPWVHTPAHTHPTWIHCASGEFEYALPLIRAIKAQNPEEKILVTYFTPSYLPRLLKEPLVDFVVPSPWDTPACMGEFLDHHQPRRLLFARTDIWFEMTRQTALRGIPVGVFSMTFSKRLTFFKKIFLRWQLQYVTHFFMVSEKDRVHLSKVVAPSRISVAGDTRYDQCLYRLRENPSLKVQASQRPLLVAGSIWPEDEDPLLPVVSETTERFDWILVPHEVTGSHIEDLKKRCLALNLRTSLYSDIDIWDHQSVLIVDKVGVLAHLYKTAHASFIGGSFKRQVHSVMESLACGCLTFVGPYHGNSREALDFKKPFEEGIPPAVIEVNAANIQAMILEKTIQWNSHHRQALIEAFKQKARVTEPLWENIRFLLKSPTY